MVLMQNPGAVIATKQQSALYTFRLIWKSSEVLPKWTNTLDKARKIDEGWKGMHQSITEYHQSVTEKSRITANVKEIQLIIHVVKEHYKQCTDSKNEVSRLS